jgi:hypothetical protein
MLDHLDGYVDCDIRICFAINWFDSEKHAQKAAEYVRGEGTTYNGGMFHGMPCGRDKTWDTERDGRKLYAVTD